MRVLQAAAEVANILVALVVLYELFGKRSGLRRVVREEHEVWEQECGPAEPDRGRVGRHPIP